jgi:hypothetical protein
VRADLAQVLALTGPDGPVLSGTRNIRNGTTRVG